MHYDPIKERLGKVFNKKPALRRIFYILLDILLLRSWHVHKAIRHLFPDVKSNIRILDAGMGFGQYTWWMSKRYRRADITAADIKSEQVSDCNRFFSQCHISGRVKAIEADLTTFTARNEYNLILCVDVMEHITEDTTVFGNFNAALTGGGKLVISTPSDKGGSDVHGADDTSFIGEHVRDGYSIDDITLKLENNGFSDVKASYTYGLPGSIAWKLSMKIPVIMLSHSRFFFALLPFYYIIVMPFCLILNLVDTSFRHSKGTGLLVIATKK